MNFIIAEATVQYRNDDFPSCHAVRTSLGRFNRDGVRSRRFAQLRAACIDSVSSSLNVTLNFVC